MILCRFAQLGAKVVLWDINKESIEAVAGEIKGRGLLAFPFCCDCSKREKIYQTATWVRYVNSWVAQTIFKLLKPSNPASIHVCCSQGNGTWQSDLRGSKFQAYFSLGWGGEENLTTRLPGLSHDWIINVSIYMNTRLDL